MLIKEELQIKLKNDIKFKLRNTGAGLKWKFKKPKSTAESVNNSGIKKAQDKSYPVRLNTFYVLIDTKY